MVGFGAFLLRCCSFEVVGLLRGWVHLHRSHPWNVAGDWRDQSGQ